MFKNYKLMKLPAKHSVHTKPAKGKPIGRGSTGSEKQCELIHPLVGQNSGKRLDNNLHREIRVESFEKNSVEGLRSSKRHTRFKAILDTYKSRSYIRIDEIAKSDMRQVSKVNIFEEGKEAKASCRLVKLLDAHNKSLSISFGPHEQTSFEKYIPQANIDEINKDLFVDEKPQTKVSLFEKTKETLPTRVGDISISKLTLGTTNDGKTATDDFSASDHMKRIASKRMSVFNKVTRYTPSGKEHRKVSKAKQLLLSSNARPNKLGKQANQKCTNIKQDVNSRKKNLETASFMQRSCKTAHQDTKTKAKHRLPSNSPPDAVISKFEDNKFITADERVRHKSVQSVDQRSKSLNRSPSQERVIQPSPPEERAYDYELEPTIRKISKAQSKGSDRIVRLIYSSNRSMAMNMMFKTQTPPENHTINRLRIKTLSKKEYKEFVYETIKSDSSFGMIDIMIDRERNCKIDMPKLHFYLSTLHKQILLTNIIIKNSRKQNPLDKIEKMTLGTPQRDKSKLKTVMIDLDETLVHAEPVRADTAYDHSFDMPNCVIGLRLRPFLFDFLEQLYRKFELVIYTASGETYAKKIRKIIDPEDKYFAGLLHRQNCVYFKSTYLKSTKAISNRDSKDIFIIENALYAFPFDHPNKILLTPFTDDNTDCELLKVLVFIREKLLGSKQELPKIIAERVGCHDLMECLHINDLTSLFKKYIYKGDNLF